jgi:hypothetical protein
MLRSSNTVLTRCFHTPSHGTALRSAVRPNSSIRRRTRVETSARVTSHRARIFWLHAVPPGRPDILSKRPLRAIFSRSTNLHNRSTISQLTIQANNRCTWHSVIKHVTYYYCLVHEAGILASLGLAAEMVILFSTDSQAVSQVIIKATKH